MFQFDIVLLLCVLLMVSYIFDITASKTKIPSIILLILSGLGLQIVASNLGIKVPDLQRVLPIMGTIGLILIVLEGSLELELRRKKMSLIFSANIIAFLSIVISTVIIAYLLKYQGYTSTKLCWINAIPLSIISSAIAIPSVRGMNNRVRQFTIYESSLSDIFGVIIFNFLILNEFITQNTFVNFFLEILLMLTLSVVATLVLAFFLARSKHHVKFIPIIIIIILLYTMGKHYHLPSLIFILIFGLVLNNISLYQKSWLVKKFSPETLIHEVHRFTEITAEFAFIVRSIFFILFGFLINTDDLLNVEVLPWSIAIVLSIFLVRFILLITIKRQVMPYLFIAPRGLITILLFLSIPVSQQIAFVNSALVIQVILLCTIVMMFGLMNYKEHNDDDLYPIEPELLPIMDDISGENRV